MKKDQPAAVQSEGAAPPATAPESQGRPIALEVQPEAETTFGTNVSTATDTKPTKRKKKIDPENVGRQLLQNFLGGQ